MSWPRDDAKLDRVRALMAEEELDALVVRAPDNVLYLTNFWGMKGYEAAVFPREGEPTLICLEASAEDAERSAWTNDVRFLAGYAPGDPRMRKDAILHMPASHRSNFQAATARITFMARDRFSGRESVIMRREERDAHSAAALHGLPQPPPSPKTSSTTSAPTSSAIPARRSCTRRPSRCSPAA